MFITKLSYSLTNLFDYCKSMAKDVKPETSLCIGTHTTTTTTTVLQPLPLHSTLHTMNWCMFKLFQIETSHRYPTALIAPQSVPALIRKYSHLSSALPLH